MAALHRIWNYLIKFWSYIFVRFFRFVLAVNFALFRLVLSTQTGHNITQHPIVPFKNIWHNPAFKNTQYIEFKGKFSVV